MKKLLALLLGLLMLLSCFAIAEETPLILQRPEDADEAVAWAKEQTWEKTYTVGFGSLSDSDPVQKVLGDRLVEWASAYGIEIVRMDNNMSGTTAVSNVQLMINQEVDAIIEFNVDASVSGAIMDMCNEAGIPVVAIDIPHEGATFFGADNYLCGEMSGEFIAKAALEKWGKIDTFLMVDQMASGELPRQRVLQAEKGLRKVIPDFPAENIYMIEGGTSVDIAMTNAAAFLAAHPDEKIAVACLTAAQPVGVAAAAEVAGRTDDILIVGNNEDAFFAYSNAESPWIGAVTFHLVEYGKWILPIVREGLDTGVWPENVYIEHEILTHDNMDELFPNWREDMAAGIYPS